MIIKSEIRQMLKRYYDTDKVQIRSNDSIHVYGVMPNTNKTGYWFFGWMGCADTNRRLDEIAKYLNKKGDL